MKTYISILILFLSTSIAYSQTNTDKLTNEYKTGVRYIIKTTYGTTHTGFVVEETEELVVIENRNIKQKTEIKKSQIISAKPLKDKVAYEDEVLGKNHHAGSYLFSCSAFEFDEGDIQSRNHWLLLQNADYAVTPNWAITSNAFAFYPMSLGIKYAKRVNEKVHAGGSAFVFGNVLNSGQGSTSFWGYGGCFRYTYGSSNRNLTLSGGVLGLNSQLFNPASTSGIVPLPFANAAYCNRFNTNLAFVTEAWYFPVTTTLLGGVGLKLVGDENYAWSFGVFSFIDTFDNTIKLNLKTYAIPYIGICRKF